MTLSPKREATILATLTAIVAVLALAGALSGASTWLEAASVVTGAVCVWLTVRENVWNFPIGLVNVACFSVLFFGSRLYADAGLQVVYFVLGVIGWRLWLRGGERGTALHVSRAGTAHLRIVAVGGAAMTLVLWGTLHHAGGSASFFDALTTSISLCAQWLLNRKHVESWYFWIAADLIYVPLYLYKDLHLTAGLYAVFLVMATMGLLRWTATWRAEGGETARPAPGAMPA